VKRFAYMTLNSALRYERIYVSLTQAFGDSSLPTVVDPDIQPVTSVCGPLDVNIDV
jgi:hypothetical protein